MREKLNVLMLVQLPPPIHGAALRNQDLVNSDIFCSACDVTVIPIQTADNIGDVGAFRFKKIINVFDLIYKTIRVVTKEKIDIAYITLSATGFALYKDVILILFAQLFGAKVVCHMRNRGLSRSISSASLGGRFFLTSILQKCKFICMSNNLANDVNLVSPNPYIISNCLTKPASEIDEEKICRRFDSKKIIYISNIAESKGALLFLDIVKSFNDMCFSKGLAIDFSFHVYGPFFSESERLRFNQHMNSKKIDNVVLEGPIYGDEKFKMLDESSLMVFPTKYDKECFPGVIMEAFSCGVPVISRGIAAIPEIISDGRNGFVHYDDPQEYAQSIISVFEDKDKYFKMSCSALDSYKNNMSHIVVHETIAKTLYMVKKGE
ncbi:glycosyltransferase family 4 protein [Rheinheimera marina]|uniref:Glycosyltransferase family 4 protein n=1 Tax=Rheinheimera marina TaxID=1774958 RepID=A0ABV9JR79_9GAMM